MFFRSTLSNTFIFMTEKMFCSRNKMPVCVCIISEKVVSLIKFSSCCSNLIGLKIFLTKILFGIQGCGIFIIIQSRYKTYNIVGYTYIPTKTV